MTIQKLLTQLAINPEDTDLMNRIAIKSLENAAFDDCNKFLQLAYDTKKTVKTSHNLAWYLFFELGEEDKAIKIQREIIKQNPKSYLPYYLFATMLIDIGNYNDALPYLKIAGKKSDRKDILHNIGCCYFYLGNFEKSEQYFGKINKEFDHQCRSAFNQAITNFKLGNLDITRKIADRLSTKVETHSFDTIGGYEIALLYFLLDDFEKASQLLIKEGISGIDLPDWSELSYSLFISNHKQWVEEHKKMITDRKNWIEEIKTDPDEWDFDSEQEKQERLNELNDEINTIDNIIIQGVAKPTPDLDKKIWIEPAGCLLFDCEIHKNIANDEE
ncbi:tetratricopeptide repeat protein [Phocoenobacter skyensis]|uniref:Tetratricopeptide repeat-containing protein n=1 Tax=Phocoenobacter skyensis TaxID=97481 RepID=A0A1H7ZVL8_9PAST|nr:hypothetical protein [Pasteurella skyensis]MDP8080357.1 hypothetical protein [Pasteurella skyensis]MDP8086353.1 hypothetical protein [Pasteurella skyensis]MDP8171119.1 hypothetical protein [Pasteurella skyensis]MDP8173850.1 hypothetical protein [Pasteurella skyensis]MDP8186075.1 hypothetical protein [Pasteurella skyensis]